MEVVWGSIKRGTGLLGRHSEYFHLVGALSIAGREDWTGGVKLKDLNGQTVDLNFTQKTMGSRFPSQARTCRKRYIRKKSSLEPGGNVENDQRQGETGDRCPRRSPLQ